MVEAVREESLDVPGKREFKEVDQSTNLIGPDKQSDESFAANGNVLSGRVLNLTSVSEESETHTGAFESPCPETTARRKKHHRVNTDSVHLL